MYCVYTIFCKHISRESFFNPGRLGHTNKWESAMWPRCVCCGPRRLLHSPDITPEKNTSHCDSVSLFPRLCCSPVGRHVGPYGPTWIRTDPYRPVYHLIVCMIYVYICVYIYICVCVCVVYIMMLICISWFYTWCFALFNTCCKLCLHTFYDNLAFCRGFFPRAPAQNLHLLCYFVFRRF